MDLFFNMSPINIGNFLPLVIACIPLVIFFIFKKIFDDLDKTIDDLDELNANNNNNDFCNFNIYAECTDVKPLQNDTKKSNSIN
jgi:hypothetical protein